MEHDPWHERACRHRLRPVAGGGGVPPGVLALIDDLGWRGVTGKSHGGKRVKAECRAMGACCGGAHGTAEGGCVWRRAGLLPRVHWEAGQEEDSCRVASPVPSLAVGVGPGWVDWRMPTGVSIEELARERPSICSHIP